jgi:hypothetical protein
MEKSALSMASESMDKATETMAKDTMEKSSESMTNESMDKSTETMAKDTMEKSNESMTNESMDKSTETMAKDTMEKSNETMTSESMDKSSDVMATENMEKMVGITVSDTLMLQLSDVQPLRNGFHYEGWAIVNGAPVSTGKFNAGPDGALVALDGSPIAQGAFDTGVDLNDATAVVITIEPAGDNDAIPASTHYLSGSVSDGKASLSIGHSAALGDDFSGAAGSYILATPTDGASNNENSGIWFLDLSSGAPSVGLDLPSLPGGWVYEGWVVIDGTPVSTGRFTHAGQADLAAPYSGAESGPPFPGEDFLFNAPEGLTFPVDLAGKVAVISVEPSPDDSPSPFALKPLVSTIPDNATDHFTYAIGTPESAFPQGSATIESGEMSKIVQTSG